MRTCEMVPQTWMPEAGCKGVCVCEIMYASVCESECVYVRENAYDHVWKVPQKGWEGGEEWKGGELRHPGQPPCSERQWC